MAEKSGYEIIDEYLDVISSEINSQRNDFLKKAGVDLNDKLAVKIVNEMIDWILGDNGFRLLVLNEDWAYIVEKGGRPAFDKAWSHMVDLMVEDLRYWCDKDWGFEQPLISDTTPKSEAERLAGKLIGPFLKMEEERFASMSYEYRLKERQKCYGIVNEVIGYLNQKLAPKVFNLFSPHTVQTKPAPKPKPKKILEEETGERKTPFKYGSYQLYYSLDGRYWFIKDENTGYVFPTHYKRPLGNDEIRKAILEEAGFEKREEKKESRKGLERWFGLGVLATGITFASSVYVISNRKKTA